MIKLDAGNVLLKPSTRKQLMSWLRRAARLGQRLGDFVLTLTLHRAGRQYEVKALVHDSAGDFDCRVRQTDLRTAVRQLVARLTQLLHTQRVRQFAA